MDARDPHTPILDRNGTLWFTAQCANKVQRLDPKSGKVDLVTLTTRRSNPCGIVISSDGMPFFAEFGGNRIGSLNPKTMELKEWSLPDERARPRRIAMAADDVLWYSDYARGYLGPLRPEVRRHARVAVAGRAQAPGW